MYEAYIMPKSLAERKREKIHQTMKEFQEKTLTSNGRTVKNRNQAIAIAIAKANALKKKSK